MDYSNPITKELIEKGWTAEYAARQFYKRYKSRIDKRGIVWTVDRFNLVKLGHDEAQWLRDLLAKFFGIDERDIPRKDKRTRRARDEAGKRMNISREARRKKGMKLQRK